MVSIRRYLPMKIVKRRCEICRKWFMPDPRTYKIQKACSKPECLQKRKEKAKRDWWKNNPVYEYKYRKEKTRNWAKEYPDYWKNYRRGHPDYVEKDNRRRRTRHKKAKNAAKQDTMRKISVDKLKGIQEIRPDFSAKQDTLNRRVDGILDYLFWKESSAKQDGMDRYC
jgi:hypothetical protein